MLRATGPSIADFTGDGFGPFKVSDYLAVIHSSVTEGLSPDCGSSSCCSESKRGSRKVAFSNCNTRTHSKQSPLPFSSFMFLHIVFHSCIALMVFSTPTHTYYLVFFYKYFLSSHTIFMTILLAA